MSTTLLLSDVHLSAHDTELTSCFLDLISHRAPHCDNVYILGDLFDVWLGDDTIGSFQQDILQALRQLTQAGISLYFMHGNRDFLIGHRFAELTGCQLLDETCIINLGGQPTLLMHGDQLCSDDVDYQKFRQQVRHPAWQQHFLSLSLAERTHLAQQARAMSVSKTQQTSDDILDANQSTIVSYMRQHGVNRLIHGHTHRPAVHHFTLDNNPAERIVLGDWCNQSSTLLIENQHYQLDDKRIKYDSQSAS